MSNRIILVIFAALFAAATLTGQMRELGHWHGGRYYGPGGDEQRERRRFQMERRQESRERLRERLLERQRMREEFRDQMRDLTRQWRFRPYRWN